MTNRKNRLNCRQFAGALMSYPLREAATATRGDWVRSLHEAPGISQPQLGARTKISGQSTRLSNAPRRTPDTLEILDRLVRAMGCRVPIIFTRPLSHWSLGQVDLA